jgi:hypothetical protein
VSDDDRNALPRGFELDGYCIESVLGVGGFGITYRAVDPIGRQVAIKEFLPKQCARREAGDATVRPISAGDSREYEWGLARFRDEAKVLLTVKHPNVVHTLRYTEAQGTAYIVMDFVEGRSLRAVLDEAGTLEQANLEQFLFPLLDGLAAVHAKGYLHRDIKPDNIYIRDEDRQPVLLDFGAARQMARTTHTVVLSHGYAPFEQYQSRALRGPSTDLYALGATLYFSMTGLLPPRATDRIGGPDPLVPLASGAKRRYAPALIGAVEQALSVDPEERPQSVAEFRTMIRPEPPTPPPTPRPAPARRALAVGIVALALTTGAAVYLAGLRDSGQPTRADSPAAPAPAAPRADEDRAKLERERKRGAEEEARRGEQERRAEEERRAEQARKEEEQRKEEPLRERAEAAAQKARDAQQRAQATARLALSAQQQARTAAQCARAAAVRARNGESGHHAFGDYEGQYSVATDQAEGCGVYVYKSGSRYEGQWKQGNRHGYGVYTSNDGERYEGSWSQGKASGYGVNHYKDGSEVQAGYTQGRLASTVVVWVLKPDALRYEGEVRAHGETLQWHGVGVVHDGVYRSRGEGEFAEGSMHGFGIVTNASGERLYRCWRQGQVRAPAC